MSYLQKFSKNRTSALLLKTFACGVFLVYFLNLFSKLYLYGDRQLDFQVYRAAVSVVAAGESPYDYKAINRSIGIAEDDFPFTYNYLPATIPFFNTFASLDLLSAKRLFLFIRIFFFGALLWVWSRIFSLLASRSGGLVVSDNRFPQIFFDPAFSLLLIFVFNRTVSRDFYAGNITVIEQFFLWSGVLALLSRRNLTAGVLIFIGGIWKLAPLVFLFLLPIADGKQGWRNFLSVSAAIGVFIGTQFFFAPQLMNDFLHNMLFVSSKAPYSSFESAWQTPSALEFLRREIPAEFRSLVRAIYYAIIIASAAVSLRGIGRLGRDQKIMLCMLMGTLLFVLLMPVRIKDYSYVMLIPAAYYTARTLFSDPLIQWAIVAVLVIHPGAYYSVWSSLFLFFVFCHAVRRNISLADPGHLSPRRFVSLN